MTKNNKIITINYSALQNSEFLGMQEKFVTFLDDLDNESLAHSLSAYKESVATLTSHLAVDCSETVKHTASRLNSERFSAYEALRSAVKAFAKLNDSGKAYVAIFDGRENIHGFNQDSASHEINAVIAAFREHSKEELASGGVEFYLEALEQKQADYLKAAKARGEASDSRIEAASLQYRNDCVTKFEILANHARALAVYENDAHCKAFIEQVNGEISMRKEKLKMRKEAAKKKAGGATTPSGVETASSAQVSESAESESPASAETVNSEVAA